MTPIRRATLRRRPRFITLVSGLLVGAFACGGETQQNTGTGSAAGARSGSGGSTSDSGGQTASGGMGAGGADTLPARCRLPRTPGQCSAYFAAYFHDPETGVCTPFSYGDCMGNENRFESLEACQETCHGGAPEFDRCDVASDCVLMSPGCCGGCEPVEAMDLIAVALEYRMELAKRCTSSCGACPPLPGGLAPTRRYFIPSCVNHQCRVVDIRDTPLVTCNVDSDCVLRAGAECCEMCSGVPVAVSRNADVAGFSCGGEPAACPACLPSIPPGYSTACTEGRCRVEDPPCSLDHPCQ